MNASTALALVKTIQSKASGSAAARRSGAGSSGGTIRIIGASIGSAPERAEPVHQLRRLVARPRDEHAPPEQRARVEPAQVLAKPDDAADDEHRRLAPRVGHASSRSSSAIVPVTVSCVGSVPL